MPDPIIETRKLTRLIPGTGQRLLDELNLAVRLGDRVGLSGASGSGKTTLMRALAALDPVVGGELLFEGERVQEFPTYRRSVIYLHQRPAMVAGTVRQNMQLPFDMATAKTTYDESRVLKWFASLEKPASILDQTVETLSGGEQQIVALIRAMQLDPTVLLLDEPTASLDAEMVRQFEQLVNDWYSGSPGRAYVWTSHDQMQLSRMTDRTVTVAGGKIHV